MHVRAVWAWFAGDLHGAPGRALWMCLAPPGHPGLWTDSATGRRGDALELLRLRLGDAPPERAIAEAHAFLASTGDAAPTMRRAPPPHALHHRAAAPVRLWNLCRPIHGSPAEAYLRARGLEHCAEHPSLRFHPQLFYRDADDAHRALPALVAAVSGPAGEFTGVQRTWLDPRRPAKARVAHPRKALGRIHGCAVYFGEVGSTLVVAQGIETALALRTARPELPVAATLTEVNFGAYTAPAHVTRVLIARDNDTASAQAAERLLARCRRRALAATVIAAAGTVRRAEGAHRARSVRSCTLRFARMNVQAGACVAHLPASRRWKASTPSACRVVSRSVARCLSARASSGSTWIKIPRFPWRLRTGPGLAVVAGTDFAAPGRAALCTASARTVILRVIAAFLG